MGLLAGGDSRQNEKQELTARTDSGQPWPAWWQGSRTTYTPLIPATVDSGRRSTSSTGQSSTSDAPEPQPPVWWPCWACLSRGEPCIVIAAFLFSLATLAVKFLHMPPFQISFIPSTLSFLVISVMIRVQGLPFVSKTRTVRLLTILRGLFGAGALTLYYIAIQMLPLKTAVTLFFSSPVIATVLESIILGGANLRTSSVLGCIATVAGVVLVTQPTILRNIWAADLGLGFSAFSPGMAVALLAATCNAVAFVIVRALGGRQSALALTWWYHLIVAGVSAIPLFLFHYPSPPVATPSAQDAVLLACVCVAQFTGQILLNRGFQLMSATRGSAINVLQVLFSYVWELTILHETTSWTALAGGACVMAGVISVALGSTDADGPAPPGEEGEEKTALARTGRAGEVEGDEEAGAPLLPSGESGSGSGVLRYAVVTETEHSARSMGGAGGRLVVDSVITHEVQPRMHVDGLLSPVVGGTSGHGGPAGASRSARRRAPGGMDGTGRAMVQLPGQRRLTGDEWEGSPGRSSGEGSGHSGDSSEHGSSGGGAGSQPPVPRPHGHAVRRLHGTGAGGSGASGGLTIPLLSAAMGPRHTGSSSGRSSSTSGAGGT